MEGVSMKVENLLIDKLHEDICKERVISRVYSTWKHRNENNDRFSMYLRRNKYDCVAIYGLGKIGKDLYDELIKDEITISFFADRFSHEIYDGREILGICELWPCTDVVIITQVTGIDDVCSDLRKKFEGHIISFMDYLLGDLL